jgi:hypothetical protein
MVMKSPPDLQERILLSAPTRQSPLQRLFDINKIWGNLVTFASGCLDMLGFLCMFVADIVMCLPDLRPVE